MLGFVPHPNLPKMPAYGDVQYKYRSLAGEDASVMTTAYHFRMGVGVGGRLPYFWETHHHAAL